MAESRVEHPIDPDVGEILAELESYKATHPRARIASYRQNSGSIRIRIIDPDFRKLDRAQRHDQIWEYLDRLPEDTITQITVLLLLTPGEVKASIGNLDFENPVPTSL